MKSRRQFANIIICILILFSCSNNVTSDWVEIDLLEKGVPVKLHTPKGVTVNSQEGLFEKDIVITNNADYNVQLFMSDAQYSDVSKRVEEEKETVKGMRLFESIVEEFPQGFVYQLALDSTTTTTDFRYFIIQGDKEYVFQLGLGTVGTLEQVQAALSGIRKSQLNKKE